MTYRLPVVDVARLLADVDADDLVAVVLDADASWWRRRLAAAGLHRRVPAGHAERLFALLVDGARTFEVHEVLAEVLAGDPGPVAEPLLTWLRLRTAQPRTYRPEPAFLRARAELGDPDVVRPLVLVAAEEHGKRRDEANAVLDALGSATVLTALGAGAPEELIDHARHPDDETRLTGVRMLRLIGGDPAPALADPSRIVARAAYDALAERSHDPAGSVERMASESAPGLLWVLAALHAQGRDITSAPAAIAAPRVKLPNVPADVRAAIVRHWAPGRRLTDPRWLVEMAFVEPAVVDIAKQLRRVGAALDSAGLRPAEPVHVDELYGQGNEGTYHEFSTSVGTLAVSTLGPFFRADDDGIVGVLRRAGLRHIDDDLAGTVVDGLCVYQFGVTDPLPVGELLFYWED